MLIEKDHQLFYKLQLGSRSVNKVVYRERPKKYYYKHLGKMHYISDIEIERFKGEIEHEKRDTNIQ